MRVSISLLGLVVLGGCAHLEQPSLTVVEDRQSLYVIYHAPDAPASVQLAAKELQRVIAIATGAKLPVVSEPASPMIALGDSAAARAAGIDPSGTLPDSFLIQTHDANVFIVGRDADGRVEDHYLSRGTLFGTYAFLERYLDVRWLLPGEWGEDIPRRDALRLPAIRHAETPAFQARTVAYIQERGGDKQIVTDVGAWIRRQKLGNPLRLQHAHAWDEYISEETLKQHPEWLAVGGDKGKFCTSRPEVVQAFAAGVLRWIEKHPTQPVITISPEDGGGFCRCDRCAPFIEQDPHGNDSFSYLILKFYNDVAKLVGQQYPDKLLCGLVYYNYMFPPQRPITAAPNVALHWAGLEYYGFGLYKPKYLTEFRAVAREWSKLTQHFSFTSYTHWMRSESGAPIPPSMELLKLEVPTIKDVGGEGVYLVGLDAWGYGAPVNYLLAKQAWDAGIDVAATYHEWLKRAYGPGWQSMREVLAMLDDAIRQHKLAETVKRNYDVTYEVITDVYLPRFERMETLYHEALRGAATEPQRKRLEMFGANLSQLRENLRRAGLLVVPPSGGPGVLPPEGGTTNSLALTPSPKPIWAPERRRLTIPRLPDGVAAPVMDGDVSDAAWQHAAVADEFRLAGTRVPGASATTARLLHDDQNLFLAFDCGEKSAAEIVAQNKLRDDAKNFWDDVVEVFFCDTPDLNRFWHLAVNPLGTQWDGLNDKVAYNLDWTSVGKVSGNRWTVEIKIPFASLNQPGASVGKTWRANLCRSQRPKWENSSWNSVEERFAVPNQFGELEFGK